MPPVVRRRRQLAGPSELSTVNSVVAPPSLDGSNGDTCDRPVKFNVNIRGLQPGQQVEVHVDFQSEFYGIITANNDDDYAW